MKLLAAALLLGVFTVVHVLVQGPPPVAKLTAYISGVSEPDFALIVFRDASLPRTVMALLVGAALGCAGSLLQQLLRNSLAAPTTLGVASGAWCALVATTALAPGIAIVGGFWIAFAGAVLATLLVFAIAGPRGMSGLPAILAGMAVNLLFGAIAQALVLIENQRVCDLGLWAAGDLQQNGWSEVLAFLPLVALLVVGAMALSRPLSLLRLGTEAASGRGLSVPLYAPLIAGIAVALTAGSVSLVGPIAFIGLLAPNAARLLGARTALGEISSALAIGAAALLVTDAMAASVSIVSRDIVVSGVVAPLIGAPVLLLVLLRRRMSDIRPADETVGALSRMTAISCIALLALLVLITTMALFLGKSETGWVWASIDGFALSFCWPRVLTAAMAGVALAGAGVVLQQLLRNPLASPEIVGISSGAGFAIALATVLTGKIIVDPRPIAIVGALCAVALLLLVLRARAQSALAVIICGIALAASMDAGLGFILSTGGDEVYSLLGFLAGTTIHADAETAAIMALGIALISTLLILLSRWLDLISLGFSVARARGLETAIVRLCLFLLAGLLVALATAAIGLAPFLGLMAPNLARLIGAGNARSQLATASLIGACLMILSDWVGRTLFYPIQIPAGLAAAILGGLYFGVVLRARAVRL